MEISSKYSPSEVEGKWYQYWLDNKLFSSKPDGREPYTVVIPPPNVTGVLHMGHVLNETIQDILVRHARMEGKNACWVPGTDHASIATEAKVVNRLAEQGIKKADLTREEFLKHAWTWTEEHGGIILKQLRKLGCSCDWDRTAFTMDGPRSESVIKVFVDLYRKGLISRGVRMVNWDPKALTALSDEEVIYKEEHTKLYYMKYYLAEAVPGDFVAGEGNVVHKDEKGYYAVVATTRPETIMGDVAMCINPNDPKNQWLKGRKVIVPVVGRVIPVIEDEYVDIEFGTGCLKVTPAHDVNDYMLGEKYNLEAIDIFKDERYTRDGQDFIPGHKLLVPVNKENAIAAGIVKEAQRDSIQDYITLTISGNNLTKFDLIMLDILANYDWSRPIYLVSRIELSSIGLEPWLQFDGFVYKLVPFLNDYANREATVDADALYDKIMNVYRFESMADTTVHWDYQNIFTFSAVVPAREIFATTASALLDRGENQKAEDVLDKCIASMPNRNFPFNVSLFRSINEWSLISIIEDYFRLDKPEKAIAVGDQLADETLKTILYYTTPIGPGPEDVLNKKLADDAATIYLYLIRIYNAFGQKEAADRLDAKLKDA